VRARLTGIFCAALALIAAPPGLLPAEPAIISIDNAEVFGSLSRPAVPFTHTGHMSIDGVSCLTCHHVIVKGKNVLDPKTFEQGDPSLRCAACHGKPADLERVFHLQCITCHNEAKRQGKVTGPRACGECHAWGG
jgi:hypothetical protein